MGLVWAVWAPKVTGSFFRSMASTSTISCYLGVVGSVFWPGRQTLAAANDEQALPLQVSAEHEMTWSDSSSTQSFTVKLLLYYCMSRGFRFPETAFEVLHGGSYCLLLSIFAFGFTIFGWSSRTGCCVALEQAAIFLAGLFMQIMTGCFDSSTRAPGVKSTYCYLSVS